MKYLLVLLLLFVGCSNKEKWIRSILVVVEESCLYGYRKAAEDHSIKYEDLEAKASYECIKLYKKIEKQL